jgi:superfamily II DNA or RNA helicase
MARLILDHQNITIKGASLTALRELVSVTSYLVQGHRFSPAFKARRWDGRDRLLVHKPGVGYVAPIGLAADIRAKLDEIGVKYDVKQRKAPERPHVDYTWNDAVRLRPYQREAVNAFCAPGLDRGRGILKMPIRSGKTKTGARIIWKLRARTLWMVPSQMLLHQTVESIQESLPGASVGQVGDGVWEQGDITVATVQSLGHARGGLVKECKGNQARDLDTGMLIKDSYGPEDCKCGRRKCKGAKRYKTPTDPRYTELMASHDLVVFDECHHLRGDAWHAVFQDSPARFRLGLSATVFLDSKKEMEKGVIWLKACCGGIKYTVDMSGLIEQGYLVRQHVRMYKCGLPAGLEAEAWSKSLHRTAILENDHRNEMIIELAKEVMDKEGVANVLIATNSLDQVARLDALLDAARLDHGIITGSTKGEARKLVVQQFKAGEFKVLVGTVFGDGVDIPEVQCVINAEGGTDAKKTIQRMRNMTPAEGKGKALLIDFWDDMNPYFRKHSRARLKTYKSEKAFVVEEMWRKKRLPATRKRR